MTQTLAQVPPLQAARDRAHALAAALETRARGEWPTLLNALWPHRLLAAALEDDEVRYGKLSVTVLALLDEAENEANEARTLFTRLLLASLAARSDGRHPGLQLPPSVTELYPPQLERILDALEDAAARIDLAEDRWKKNYALLTGRLIPVGAEFADPHSGIPRSMLFHESVGQRLQVFLTAVLQTRGFRPLFDLHAHPDSLGNFNPEGWIGTYQRLAELLLLNPGYKGFMASSWFRDPQLATISPKLRYLREYPMRHGAKMFRVCSDAEGSSGALARSPTRQRLFREGKYVPTIHLMVWPRESLLRWHFGRQGKHDPF